MLIIIWFWRYQNINSPNIYLNIHRLSFSLYCVADFEYQKFLCRLQSKQLWSIYRNRILYLQLWSIIELWLYSSFLVVSYPPMDQMMDNIVIQKLKTGRTCYFEESLVVTDTICRDEITFVLWTHLFYFFYVRKLNAYILNNLN